MRVSGRGFDSRVIRAAYASVAEDYAASFAEDLAELDLDRRVLDAIASHCADDGVVIDVGCGPAQNAAYLMERDAPCLGVDFTPAMLAVARRRVPGLRVLAADLRALPVRTGSAAGVVAFYVLQHLPRPDLAPALRELRRVLMPNGLLAAAVHAGAGAFDIGEVSGTRYSHNELVDQLGRVSLAIDMIDRRGTLPHEHQGDRIYLVAHAT
jgi:ubiquinone/menaquinone biosynthesis C-methylase UbiE